jgi:hypothetical protein
MSSTNSTTKATTLAHVQALIAGTQKHFPTAQFTFGGITYTAASLVPLLQSVADAITAVNALQASAKEAVAAMQGTEAKADPIIRGYQRFLRATFAAAAQSLVDFDLAPPKARTPRTVEQKAAAKAKAAATRLARGTTSKKKKLSVTGNVIGVTVTPITAPTAAPPAAPVPPVTPASPAAQPVTATSSAPTPGIATK